MRLYKTAVSVYFNTLSDGNIHSPGNEYVPANPKQSSHIWLRIDRVLKPLEALYSGLSKVVEITSKTATIEKEDGKQEIVSIDRLKPAIIERKDCISDRTRQRKQVSFSKPISSEIE